VFQPEVAPEMQVTVSILNKIIESEPPTPDGVEDKYLQRAMDIESEAEKTIKTTKGKRKRTPDAKKAMPKDQSASKKISKFAGLTSPRIMRAPFAKAPSKTSFSNMSSCRNLKAINILTK